MPTLKRSEWPWEVVSQADRLVRLRDGRIVGETVAHAHWPREVPVDVPGYRWVDGSGWVR